VDEVWQALGRVLDECLAEPVWAKPDSLMVDEVDRLVVAAQRVAAATLARVREIDGRGLAVGAGASSTVAWLRDRHRMSGGAASRLVTVARALDSDLSPTAAALAAGAVNVEQAQVITDAVAKLPPEHRKAGEEHLLGEAACFGPRELGRLGQRIFEVVAPGEAEKQALAELERAERRAWHDRGLWLTDIAGTSRVRLTGWLDQEGAASVRAALDPLCAPRNTRRTNDTDGDDTRSPAQRRADTLFEVCRLASACGELPDNGGDRPQVVVTIDYESLRQQIGAGTFDDGSCLSPAAARRLACDAGIIPTVLGTTSQTLDLGRHSRLVTGPLRRALVLRDKGCAFPGCDRPPRWTDAHHIQHWSDGGRTDLGNLALLCGHHHRLVHHSEWRVRINPKDGLPEFVPPSYMDSEQRPRRNKYHRRE
jgi:Domain of unknown function (DUF222)/HNH endonuclease